ncbi:MAG: DUF177 domain-containing protein [Anaerolineae bacterium]|nr:DUF177 domain-containing protein [Anaerolineae bacterium]
MVRIKLASLTHAQVGQREAVVLDFESLEVDDLFLASLKGELVFTRVANGILVEGNLNTAAQTECTRCLDSFFVPILVELEGMIGLPGASLSPERPVRVSEDGWVDLAPLIREHVWLGLPLNPVCSPDCAGLCPECGGNINRGECTCTGEELVDPRWEVLRSLLKQNGGD